MADKKLTNDQILALEGLDDLIDQIKTKSNASGKFPAYLIREKYWAENLGLSSGRAYIDQICEEDPDARTDCEAYLISFASKLSPVLAHRDGAIIGQTKLYDTYQQIISRTITPFFTSDEDEEPTAYLSTDTQRNLCDQACTLFNENKENSYLATMMFWVLDDLDKAQPEIQQEYTARFASSLYEADAENHGKLRETFYNHPALSPYASKEVIDGLGLLETQGKSGKDLKNTIAIISECAENGEDIISEPQEKYNALQEQRDAIRDKVDYIHGEFVDISDEYYKELLAMMADARELTKAMQVVRSIQPNPQ